MSFLVNEIEYEYELKVDIINGDQRVITKEILRQMSINKTIIKRDQKEFLFNDSQMPKLPNNKTSIYLLKDEVDIKPIYEGFGLILQRDFGESPIKEHARIEFSLYNHHDKISSLQELFKSSLTLNTRLYILKKSFPEIYKNIVNEFLKIFPFVKVIDILTLSEFDNSYKQSTIPILCIKEKSPNQNWVPIDQISTGMFKVLLILSDLLSLADGSIYIIDEYENSLGVNAIHFLPKLLNIIENDIQIIITSHHPHLINKIPIDNWIIFNRKGLKIEARFGLENKKLYGNSKHDQFINLLNDPFYNGID